MWKTPLLQLSIYFEEQEAYDVHYFIEYEVYEIPVSVSGVSKPSERQAVEDRDQRL